MTMATLRVSDVLRDRILVSRESAQRLLESIRHARARSVSEPAPPLVVDFDGVEGIAPSFLDELLSAFEPEEGSSGIEAAVIVANPPARLSSKFEAVARGRSMTIEVQQDGSWLLSSRAASVQRALSK